MKKRVLIFLCCISIALPVVYFASQPFPSAQQESVYIAVVGPLGEPPGKAMRRGVELYGEQINEQGGIDGRKVEFIFRDDQNDPKSAEEIAHALAVDNKVLAVLGHYHASTSLASGKIYKKNEIPAITASASSESVISDNEWYFRTVPGSAFEAEFSASYMYDILSYYRGVPLSETVEETIPASIIFSNDEYGLSLLENFERITRQFDMEIKGKWAWDYEKTSTEQIERIKKELTAINDPGVIYFATHAAEGAEIITALKDAGGTYPMIASVALSRNFLDKLQSYAKERETPGYYSDGIYFLTPFLLSLSGVKGFEFARQFFAKYREEPGVVAACYYDAVDVAVRAIKESGVHGKKHIREDRRNIRAALAGLYNEEKGVKGVTGPIWFDRTGGVRREYAVGRWLRQKALPAFVQYDQYNRNIDDILKGYLEGTVEILDNITMTATQIVHVNVENLKLLETDKKKSEFSAAFLLRFRYPARFEDSYDSSKESVVSPLEFSNALTPIVLGKPVREETEKGITTKVFQVQGRFRADSDSGRSSFFSREQEMFIRFRHATQPYDRLVYISGITDEKSGQTSGDRSVTPFLCYSDILSKNTTLGDPEKFNTDFRLNYSQLNIAIHPDKNIETYKKN